ncbi:hypothetical protein [Rhizobium sp. 9140]|uniref:hypothetical protein n=1 Tax=Rhizobium sp. 9140 TaxID=1761900 RepID=UPI001111A79F|nr:hypothetical protein [Rhizobium sp. 9140]
MIVPIAHAHRKVKAKAFAGRREGKAFVGSIACFVLTLSRLCRFGSRTARPTMGDAPCACQTTGSGSQASGKHSKDVFKSSETDATAKS